LVLVAATVLSTVAVWFASFRGSSQTLLLARVCTVLGACLLLFGLVGSAAGLISTFAGASRIGLSEADRTRLRTNGYAEAFYNLVLTLPLAVPALIVARRAMASARRS
jgi:hypothetical protein